MIKKFALALSMTTICANTHPTLAMTNNEILDTTSKGRMIVKKALRSELVTNRRKARMTQRTARTARMERRKNIRIARRQFDPIRTRAGSRALARSRVLIQKMVTVEPQIIPYNVPLASVLNQIVLTRTPTIVTPRATIVESVVNPVRPIVEHVEISVRPIVEHVETSVRPIVEHAVNPVRPIVEHVETSVRPIVEHVENPDRPIVEPAANPVRPIVEHAVNPVRPIVEHVENQDRPVTAHVENPIREVAEHVVAPTLTIIQNIVNFLEPRDTNHDETIIQANLVQPELFHEPVFDHSVTNVALNLEEIDSDIASLTNGLNQIKEESYNGYFPNYFGKYPKIALEHQKEKVENLLIISGNIGEKFSSINFQQLEDSDESHPKDLRRLRKRVEKINDKFENLTNELLQVKNTIDELPLAQIHGLVKMTEQETQEVTPSEEGLTPVETPTAQTQDLTNSTPVLKICGKPFGCSESQVSNREETEVADSGVYTLKISGQTISYPLKERLEDKEKGMPYLVDENFELPDLDSSHKDPVISVGQEDEITEPKVLQSSVILSGKLEGLKTQVSALLNLGDKVNHPDIQHFKEIMITPTRYLRNTLESKDLQYEKSSEIFEEELTLLRSSLANYNVPTEDAEAAQQDSRLSTWLGPVTFWAAQILEKFKF